MSARVTAALVARLCGRCAGVTLILAAGCGSARHAAQPAASPSQRLAGSASPARSPAPGQSCGIPEAAAPHASDMLNAVQFVSPTQGWVAGSDRILHTSDGGRDWVTQFRTRPPAQLGAVDFADARHGWVTGTSEILATTDGGAHWHMLPEPCTPIRSVHFFSPSDGVAVAGGKLSYWGVIEPPMGASVLLGTTDGGRHWHRIPAPPRVQTVCFTSARHGWLGADGNIYGTADGGRTWTLGVRGPDHAVAEVQCAGPLAAWAQLLGPGAEMSQEPQLGYHAIGATWRPIFAEQYFPHPGVRVTAESPGSDSGPFSAISQDRAVFIGTCLACSPPPRRASGPRTPAAVPMVIALRGGAVLVRRGQVGQLSWPLGAAFVNSRVGWVTGFRQGRRDIAMIEHTADGGRTWQLQYVLGR